ncbi:PH domain-containing protein [Streptomyces sp. C]|uniref:PH domain-containing protein n=1 Tax=Streptomyces sp. C TaxID=253839 RepID=UPI0001B55D6D|nr:PH domain-containing protein [Streptomyces sp. C]EFL17996.1 conserved hypothetical protein [Streptomyces sp. C]
MPLPFLTADGVFDAHEDEALPHVDPERWRRPYRPGPWRVAGASVLLLLAAFMLLATVIIAFAGTWTGAGIALAASLTVVGSALRILRSGVWVSPSGLRRVGFFGTRSVSWSQVEKVRTVQQPVRWLGLPRTVQGQALTVSARGREEQVLLTDHSADFLARGEAFDRAVGRVEAWAEEYRGVPA